MRKSSFSFSYVIRFANISLLLLFISSILPIQSSESAEQHEASEYQIKAVYLFNFLQFVHWSDASFLSAKEKSQLSALNDSEKHQDNNNAINISSTPGAKIHDINSVTIGILGKDSFGNSFSKVEGQPVKLRINNKVYSKKLIIKRLGPYHESIDLEQCHLLFLASSEKNNFRRIITRIRNSTLLTVSDSDSFCGEGGMIHLIRINELIRWRINRKAVLTAKINLNSRVYQNAVEVLDDP